MKKKILFMGDGGCNTGFARVCKEIVSRFAKTGLYDCGFLMWAGQPNMNEISSWKEIGVKVAYCTPNPNDQFGQYSFHQTVDKFRPDIVWTLGDPWMVEHVSKSPLRDSFKWISYVPIDRDQLNQSWIPSLKNPDCLVLYSQFGQDVVAKYLPRVKSELILHGVDSDVFRPIDKNEAKRLHGIKPETFVVGFVGRNQIRKRIPRLMRAYYFWNCLNYSNNVDIDVTNSGRLEKWNAVDYARSVCHMRPEKWHKYFKQDPSKFDSMLYMHTTEGYTDQNDGLWIGWHLSEYSSRFKLDDNPHGNPSRVVIPSKESISCLQGIPDDELNSVYNMIDLHVLPSCREGFGLPILEAMSCGVPSVVADYSSMPELVADGRGFPVRISDFDDEPFYDAPSALVAIDGIVEAIDQYRSMLVNGEARAMAQKCRQYAIDNDWKIVFRKFNKIVREMIA